MILVTGAEGFVARALLARPLELGMRRALRHKPSATTANDCLVGEIDAQTDWRFALQGVEHVVHLAARTHVLHEHEADPLSAYRRVNVDATRRLAQQAIAAGVRRFVFLSSIKVNGESTAEGQRYSETDTPAPIDAYGISKLEAEDVLRDLAAGSTMELVILRSPLVYGPGVKGNFLRLMQWIARGALLPLGSIGNRRSLVYLENLVDAVVACIDTPAAAGKTYLVSDGEDVSTPDLVRAIAVALGVKPRLLPCPTALLELAGSVLGRNDALARLTGSLQIDASRIRVELGWRPHRTLDEGLAQTARWFRTLPG